MSGEVKGREIVPIRETPSVPAPGVKSEKSCGAFVATIACHNERSNIAAAPLLDLLADLKRAGTSKGGPEYHGPCPYCGGTDRFIVWPERGDTGRYWCRQCGKRGDAIQLLRDRDGCTFVEAKRRLGLSVDSISQRTINRQRAHQAALSVAYDTYDQWARRKMITLTDEYRELLAELDTVETAYRQIHRRPDLYPDKDEALDWIWKLYTIRERLAALEYPLDVLTYQKHELARVRWWKEEEERHEHRRAA